jgi:Na+/H+ antiporter NhaD/arsenite permease-like protein
MKRFLTLLKQETVLVIACGLAVVSALFVPPDRGYLDYVDLRTLCILFCLMTVVAGLRRRGVFEVLSQKLLRRAQTMGQLTLLLVLLCFFSSMVITNDVALLTFVPFTFVLLEMVDDAAAKGWAIPIVVMQTIAANLGSMLTPLGNPQNLYLYGKAGLRLGEFVLLMLPYSAVSLILLCLWVLVRSRRRVPITVAFAQPAQLRGGKVFALYVGLFVVSLLAVLRVVSYWAAFAAVLVCVLAADRGTLREVDYSLLLTFAGFFVFIGNMGRVPAFRIFLEGFVAGRETLTAVLASQVLSNVPATLLLADFTDDLPALIVGANLGGLGTLIASMASLISYKLFARREPAEKGRYLLTFTAANVAFLLVLLCCRGL